MKKKLFFIFACIAAASSCTDKSLGKVDERLTADEQALHQLEDRISSVEQTLLQLNTDIRSLIVLRGGVTINKVEGGDSEGWTLTICDGSIVTIPPEGPQGNAPVISLDDEGYWMVDYGDGPRYILDQDGNKVNQLGKGRSGQDAQYAPTLGVTEDGYWEISYDGGQTWILLLDLNGEPVPTVIEEGETIFDGVETGDTSVKFNLKNGESFVLPLVRNFLCSIQGASDPELFVPGQTKQYDVLSEGIAEMVVTCPNGWSAACSGSILTVTAPQSATKLYFDSEKYVSIYAVSTDGHSVISSMNVGLSQ